MLCWTYIKGPLKHRGPHLGKRQRRPRFLLPVVEQLEMKQGDLLVIRGPEMGPGLREAWGDFFAWRRSQAPLLALDTSGTGNPLIALIVSGVSNGLVDVFLLTPIGWNEPLP